MTYLCVPIFVTELEKARRDIAAAIEAGADLVELRIDKITDRLFVADLLSGDPPAVVTCRPAWEGGQSTLDDFDRGSLLSMGGRYNAHYLDVELKSAQMNKQMIFGVMSDVQPGQRTKLILSSHHFDGRPQRLYNIVEEMNGLPGHITKIAWTARSIRDNLDAFELLQLRQRPTIAVCMGEVGVISRILAKKFGGFLTFASLTDEEATAPGQITVTQMKNLYRWDAIKPSTKVYGVVADPVGHSMSPAIHNAAFGATDYDGVYVPLLVEKSYESFKAFMETFVNFNGLDLSGLSVTIPHKQNALRYLQEQDAQVEELAVRIGAVNTIAIDRSSGEPVLSGTNTDYAAILDSITDKMGAGRENLRGLRVAVLGAGGTARAAVAALAHCGAAVFIANRTEKNGRELAGEFDGPGAKVAVVSMAELRDADCRLWINTTSVGMHPDVDQSPLGDLALPFNKQTIVFDTVYNPMKTKLLKQAEAAGAKTIGGVEMFVRQAAAQFTTWTGKPAPMDVMRRVVESRLSPTS